MNYDLQMPLCRASDPLTSFKAADAAKQFKQSQKRRIVAALEQHGPNGVDAIGRLCGMSGHAVGKRTPELEAEGKIKQTGRDVLSDSGHDQREWQVM